MHVSIWRGSLGPSATACESADSDLIEGDREVNTDRYWP